jgi:hypothetical protein
VKPYSGQIRSGRENGAVFSSFVVLKNLPFSVGCCSPALGSQALLQLPVSSLLGLNKSKNFVNLKLKHFSSQNLQARYRPYAFCYDVKILIFQDILVEM